MKDMSVSASKLKATNLMKHCKCTCYCTLHPLFSHALNSPAISAQCYSGPCYIFSAPTFGSAEADDSERQISI